MNEKVNDQELNMPLRTEAYYQAPTLKKVRIPEYEIDFTLVKDIEDIKKILKSIGIKYSFEPEEIKHLLIETI